MFITYVVIAIIGIILGIFVFFLGLSLFGIYVKSAKADAEAEQGAISDADNVDNEEKKEYVPLDSEGIERRKKMFTPLPTLIGIEGAILFLFNIVMLILKFKIESFVEFYVLLAVDLGVGILATLINGIVMSSHVDDENSENSEEKVDNIENNSENGIDNLE